MYLDTLNKRVVVQAIVGCVSKGGFRREGSRHHATWFWFSV